MISVTENYASQWAVVAGVGEEYRLQQSVSIEGLKGEFPFSMRSLLHFAAYRLDTGFEDYVENHELAVLLRSLCDRYYPHREDDAAAPKKHDIGSSSLSIPLVDPRRLNLRDGLAVIEDTFTEPLSSGQSRRPALVANSELTLDFLVPKAAFATHGIKGLRISALELLNWLQSDLRLRHNAHRRQEEYVSDFTADVEAIHLAREQRLLEKYGADALRNTEAPASAALGANAEKMLSELAGLTF